MSTSTKKVTNAILSDIEEAQRYNYTNVPKLHTDKKEKVGLFTMMLRRYYIETCLYAVEKWEMHVTNAACIAIFFFIAKSLFTLAMIAFESVQQLF